MNGNLEPLKTFAESNSSEAISSIMANFETAKNIHLQIFVYHFKFCQNKSAGCILVLFFYPTNKVSISIPSIM